MHSCRIADGVEKKSSNSCTGHPLVNARVQKGKVADASVAKIASDRTKVPRFIEAVFRRPVFTQFFVLPPLAKLPASPPLVFFLLYSRLLHTCSIVTGPLLFLHTLASMLVDFSFHSFDVVCLLTLAVQN